MVFCIFPSTVARELSSESATSDITDSHVLAHFSCNCLPNCGTQSTHSSETWRASLAQLPIPAHSKSLTWLTMLEQEGGSLMSSPMLTSISGCSSSSPSLEGEKGIAGAPPKGLPMPAAPICSMIF